MSNGMGIREDKWLNAGSGRDGASEEGEIGKAGGVVEEAAGSERCPNKEDSALEQLGREVLGVDGKVSKLGEVFSLMGETKIGWNIPLVAMDEVHHGTSKSRGVVGRVS